MNDEVNKIEDDTTDSIYYYKNEMGEKFTTPNPILAQARAEHYGTDNVYVEIYTPGA